MPMQVLINLFIGLLWMLFQDQVNILTFFTGYLVGIAILFILRRYLTSEFYLFPLFAVFNLFLVFIYELLTSSIIVVKQVLSPNLNITPGIFKLETDMEGEIEVTLLALLITLTPGSVVMEVSSDNKFFYIHGMDLPDSLQAVKKSKERFEKMIKKVTRR